MSPNFTFKNIVLSGWMVLVTMLATQASGLTPEPAKAQTDKLALVGGTLHTVSNGTIQNGVLTIADGKISGVYYDAAVDLSDYNKIDITGQHVYPGFILPDSHLGLVEVDAIRHTRDMREKGSLNPNVRTLTAYNTDSELIPTMRFNGILVAQITPRGGLVSGSSSIVQLDAWNWEDAAITVDDGIHVRWPNRSYYKYDATTDSVKLTENEDYQSSRDKLEGLFNDFAGQSAPNLKLDALTGLFDGSQTLYINASRPQAINEAITYFKSVGIKKLVLKSGSGALLATSVLRENNIPVLIDSLHLTPQQAHHDIDQIYRLPITLQAQGIKVGLSHNDWLMGSRNLAFNAGNAVAYGMSKQEALRMITLSNAEILGIDNRLGSLEIGKDATLFVANGDALDMRGQNLSHAWINGRKIDLVGTQQQLHQRFKKKYSR